MGKRYKKAIWIALTVILVIFVGVLALMPKLILGNTLGKHIERPVYGSKEFGVSSEEISLTTEDSLKITSWLVETEKPKGTVIILSGIENPSVTAFFGYAKMLKDNGYNSLLIEMRGHNRSEGDQVYLGMREWLDVKAGVDYINKKDNLKDLPIVVMGTSMGGATALVSAGELKEIDGVISISAYSSFSNVFEDNMDIMGIPSLITFLEKPFINLYLGMHYTFKDLSYSPINSLGKMDKMPILLMHSDKDSQVPHKSFERLTEKAKEVGLNFETYTKKGDYHFIVEDNLFRTPEKDEDFSSSIIGFLNDNFDN